MSLRLKKSVKQILLFVGCILFSQLMFAEGTVNLEDDFSPLLTLNKPIHYLPFLDIALRDPLYKGQHWTLKQADELEERVAQYPKLLNDKPKNANNVMRNYFEDLLTQAYFYEDTLAGKVAELQNTNQEENTKKLYSIRRKITELGHKLIKTAKLKEEKVSVAFHLALVDYLDLKTRGNALQSLHSLLKLPLKEDRKNIVGFAIALSDAFAEDANLRAAAQKHLQTFTAILTQEASTLAAVTLARSYVGMDNEGIVKFPFNPDYRKPMLFASNLCNHLSPKQKEETMQLMTAVWLQAKDFQGEWQNPPFKSDGFMKTPTFLALEERTALEFYKSGQLDKAKDGYTKILKDVGDQRTKEQMYYRQALIGKQLYGSGVKASEWQSELMALSQILTTASVYYTPISNMHFALVQTEIEKTLTKPENNSSEETLKLAQTFLKSISHKQQVKDVKMGMAKIYEQAANYTKACPIYRDLADQSEEMGSKKEFLTLELNCESKLAKWPLADAWGDHPKDLIKEREQLLNTFYALKTLDAASVDWNKVSHIGLLEMHQGREDKAFEIWSKTIKEDGQNDSASKALALILITLDEQESWEKMESFINLGIEKNIKPALQSRAIDLREALEKSLFEQSLAFMQDKAFDKAVAKLTKLKTNYADSLQYSHYLYQLATAYKELGQFSTSLVNLEEIITLKPSVVFYREALLDSSTYYIGMGELEKAIHNLNLYLTHFPKDEERLVKLYKEMSAIYMALGEWENAKMITEKVNVEKLSAEEKKDYFNEVLSIYEKLGNPSKLHEKVESILSQDYMDFGVKARGYDILAKEYFEENKAEGLQDLSNRIVLNTPAGSKPHPSLVEAKDLVLFYQAKLLTQKVLPDVVANLSSTSQEALVNAKLNIELVQTSFEKICQNHESPHCLSSQSQLVNFYEKVLNPLHSLLKEVDPPKETKGVSQGQLLVYVEKANQDLKAKMLEGFKNAETYPQTTQEILWQQKYDFNLSQGKTLGTGFLQLLEPKQSQKIEKRGTL